MQQSINTISTDSLPRGASTTALSAIAITTATTTTTTTTTITSTITSTSLAVAHSTLAELAIAANGPLPQSLSSSSSSSSSSSTAAITSSSSSSSSSLFSPSSELSLTSSSSSSSSSVYSHPHHQYARAALLAVGDKASRIINQTRASYPVMRFSIDTVTSLVPGSAKDFTANQWNYYGDPILKKIDEKLDEAVNAIQNATSGLQAYGYIQQQQQQQHVSATTTTSSAISNTDNSIPTDDSSSLALMELPAVNKGLYTLYWERLKEKFIASHWYVRVDSILLQNSVVKAFSERMVRPAEVFFNTVTEEFLSHGAQDEFLTALQTRVGPAWDDRLAPLAKGFYTTAKAVSAIVGAGKFVGGALQLGRIKVNHALDELLEQWDRVLGLSDEIMDRWLPERGTTTSTIQQQPQQHLLTTEQHHESDQIQIQQQQSTAIGLTQQEQRLPHRHHHHRPHPHPYRHSQTHQTPNWVPQQHHQSLNIPGEHYNSDDSLDEEDDDEDDDEMNSDSPMDSFPVMNGHLDSINFSINGKKRAADHLNSMQYEDSIEEDDSSQSSDYDVDSSPNAVSLKADHLAHSHPDRTGQVLISKFGKRIRQRIPSIATITTIPTINAAALSSFTVDLKQRLTDNSWFTLVDEILMQNALVKALAAFVRPAEHFFNTSLQLFTTKSTIIHTDQTVLALPPIESVEDEQDQQMLINCENSAEILQPEQQQIQFGQDSKSNGTDHEIENKQENLPLQQSQQQQQQPQQSVCVSPKVISHTNAISPSLTSSVNTTPTFPTTAPLSICSSQSSSSSPFLPAVIPAALASFPSSFPSSVVSPSSSSPSSPTSPAASLDLVVADFVYHLREQLGGSWDDRLYQPARSFYETAHTTATQILPRSSA